MFNRFTKDARRVVADAIDVARELGASAVEAEHLLLAVTRGGGAAARVLHDEGLDYDGLAAALVTETTRSLAAAGVTAADALAFSPYVERPRLATSAKLALERALRVAIARADKQIAGEHITLGILRATTGTVPRALECAGVDRAALTAKVERAADGAPPSP
jgi:ATP-dependent Clp protease ATP-binding subunit ClpA